MMPLADFWVAVVIALVYILSFGCWYYSHD